MARLPLLLIGRASGRMRGRLTERFEIVDLPEGAERAAFLRERGEAFEAILTNGYLGVPDDVAGACTALKVVSCFGVGYDGIDAASLAKRGVLVSHTPGVLNDEVAVTAILLWFAVSRRLLQADRWARSGRWERDGSMPLTVSPQGRDVGILGMGRIGRTVAERARAFGARIHYHSRSQKDVEATYHESPRALAAAVEVLIAVVPGGEQTRHLIDREVLEALGPDGILVNVARGSVVDQAALIDMLEHGGIAGAGLDVFEEEPAVPEALKAMENVVLTPHVGSATEETRAAMGDLACENLEAWAEEGRVRTPVPESAALNA